ncbi:hypothetical protein JCGZ_14189 [Jatropha curcas]|uniref:Uncharacterized protein n=1 Tax=Jatropha curcas TaxID=180498 RepID=A0A067K044_JATCU|nr:uncharacterized protein LOC105642778 [Jatropha curcas]KDP28418.1 hypothetical protein JCGZ_14189 [Jatropha curcas]
MARDVGRQVRANGGRKRDESLLTRMVNAVFSFVKFAEFEILFFFFFLIAFIIFKDLTSRPEYNQILVKKPDGMDFWAY